MVSALFTSAVLAMLVAMIVYGALFLPFFIVIALREDLPYWAEVLVVRIMYFIGQYLGIPATLINNKNESSIKFYRHKKTNVKSPFIESRGSMSIH